MGQHHRKHRSRRGRLRFHQKIDSETLKVDGWHHRTDALASTLVAIAIVSARYGRMWVDPVLGIGVSVTIIYVAVSIGLSSIHYLLGRAPEEKMVERIKRMAFSFPGVAGVHGIDIHSYGEHKAVALHIEVARDTDLEKAHQIASSVESMIVKNFNASCVVHVDLKKEKKRTCL
ncbi:MAG: cation diffusion facilitator family transporter [Acidobacteriota bacterium]